MLFQIGKVKKVKKEWEMKKSKKYGGRASKGILFDLFTHGQEAEGMAGAGPAARQEANEASEGKKV